jgi:hypothetical protein
MTNKQHIVDQLNKLITLDRSLTEQLINGNYQPVSQAYQDADEFVWCYNDEQIAVAGFLGVLNGILEQDDFRIAADFTGDKHDIGQLIGFSLIKVKQ